MRRALDEVPATERPYVFTKCGMVWDEADRMAPPRQVLRPESIRRECEASLRRLGVERIDLYQFHWPDETGIAVEDSWAEMARLVDEGKVRAAGVSNFDVAAARALRGDPPRGLAAAAVLAHPAAGRGAEIPWCAAHGTGVIVYSPMQSGLLTDRFSAGAGEGAAGGRLAPPVARFNPPRLGRNLALRDALRPVAERHGATVAEIAIAWTLAWTGRHRRDRRRAHAGAGGRLDRRRVPRAHRRGPGGDRRRSSSGPGPAPARRSRGSSMGIHHVTAIAREPQRNLDFYAGTLGMRLVKLTINYDDPGTYHLYYGDELGRPGSLLTFFPWTGGRPGRQGTGRSTASGWRAAGLARATGSSGCSRAG